MYNQKNQSSNCATVFAENKLFICFMSVKTSMHITIPILNSLIQ